MTKEFPMMNVQAAAQRAVAGSSFGLRHSLVIRVSPFVIPSFIPRSAFRTPHFHMVSSLVIFPK
jgi:hypothetical protein